MVDLNTPFLHLLIDKILCYPLLASIDKVRLLPSQNAMKLTLVSFFILSYISIANLNVFRRDKS
jgi:hypothetical protein